MRVFDKFIFVFLCLCLFTGYMSVKSMIRQNSLIKIHGPSSSKNFRSLRDKGMFSTGLWLLFFLFSTFAMITNFAISYYEHKGFEAHEEMAPIFPGAVPIKMLPDIGKKGQKSQITVGRYEVNADPEIIIAYYRDTALDGGWKYDGAEQNLLIDLTNDNGTKLQIVIMKKSSSGASPLCELYYLHDE